MTYSIKVFCDGSVSKPRYGRAVAGWVILNSVGKELISGAKIVEDGTELATVNTAEYSAILLALDDVWIEKHNLFVNDNFHVYVYTDSQLVVCQLNGEYACTKPHLISLRDNVLSSVRALNEFGISVSFRWIPREQNTRADGLSKSLHDENFGKKKGKKNAKI